MTSKTVFSRRLPAPISLPVDGDRAAFLRELDTLLRSCRISRTARPAIPVCSAGDEVAPDADSTLQHPTRMGRVVSFIDENLDTPLTLNRLAKEAELSKYHFSRVFRQEVGLPPWSFVRRARVDRARGLLERGTTPAAAAVEAGFCDQSHLTRAMKDIVGKTPKQVQKEAHRADREDVQEDRKDVQE